MTLRKIVSFLVLWLLLLGLYLITAGDTDVQEITAGAVVAAAVSLIFRRARSADSRYLPRLRWFLPFLKVPGTVLQECWLLLLALLRQLFRRDFPGGSFIEFRIRPVEGEPQAPGRIALTSLGVCLTPNDYVITVDTEKRIARIRILVGRKLSGADTAFLELR